MLKIGEFSALTGVPVKTLRYYDEVGLLEPASVDPDSAYRYYSVAQLPRLHRILALRDLGFSLEQIGRAVRDGISPESLRGMLMLRAAEQEERLSQENERLQRLRALLQLIDHEGDRAGEVVLKNVGTQLIVSLRERIGSYRDVGSLFARLYRAVDPATVSMGIAIWHDTEHRQHDLDVEAGVCVKRPVVVEPPATLSELEAATVASIVHHGPFARIKESAMAIFHWIEANRYHAAGPTRQLFLHVGSPAKRDDESSVIEIQIPIVPETK